MRSCFLRVLILESLRGAVCNPSATAEEKNARAIVSSYTGFKVVGVQLPNLRASARIDISRAGAFALWGGPRRDSDLP
jgi:hypothetical protein